MLNVKTIATGFIATSLFIAAIPASASVGTTVETRITAAQLQTQQGIVTVYEHLKNVATESCKANGVASLADKRTAANCADNLLEEFIESVGDQNLSQFYISRKNA